MGFSRLVWVLLALVVAASVAMVSGVGAARAARPPTFKKREALTVALRLPSFGGTRSAVSGGIPASGGGCDRHGTRYR